MRTLGVCLCWEMYTFIKYVADEDVAADRHICLQRQVAGALVDDFVLLL